MTFLLAACASSGRPPPMAGAATPAVEVSVVRDGHSWTADYRFQQPAPVWVFRRSSLDRDDQRPWRPQSWTVETPGVRLARLGQYDVLIADTGVVPDRVRIRFTPFARDLLADYDPALVFTDGSVALYDQHFEVFPVASPDEAGHLPIDLTDHPETESTTRIGFQDRSGPVLHAGRRHERLTLESSGTYVLFGPAEPLVTDAMATLIDPQLPDWLRSALAADTPAILAEYAERLGPAPGGKPTFLISWAGPTDGVQSMGGSVLPSLVVMRFEGEGVLQENAQVRNSARWFIAHEAAHFWLGQAVRYQYSRDAWITEGGADLLAVRMVASIDPSYDARAALQASLDDCIRFAAGRSIAGAEERNEHDAYYKCGAMFGLAAEAVARRSGGDFFTFVSGLIQANREDAVLTKAEWLAELGRLSGDQALEREIRAMVETGVADPAATLESLFRLAGVPHRRDEQRNLRLL
ncbi:MAG TPA: hypothetical protein VFO69_01050 [Allosphingosinicella sp.]|nr:hypothetical protein [Allosphingosinicella sp.]